ncbi:MAG: hypothetical protein WDO15_11225 [Bacteroidota bacterium]
MTLGQFNTLMSMTVAVPASVGVVSVRRLSTPARYLLLMFIATLIVEITAYVLIRNKMSSIFLFGPFLLIETATVCIFYQRLIPVNRYLMAVAFCLVAGIAIWEMIARAGVFSTLSIGISRVLFIALGIVLLYRYAGGRVYTAGIVIINSTMLFYCVGNLVYFIVAADMKDMDALLFMIRMHSIVNAFCNISFAYGLWKLRE